MSSRGDRGFTLIELLTVIAIIGILAAMVTLGLGRAMEKAKIARADNALNQLRNELVSYFTSHRETFPPRYGYLKVPENANLSDEDQYSLSPYTTYIKVFRSEDLYDEFSISHDTNKDGIIQLLEYSPPGTKVGLDQYEFPGPRFTTPRPMNNDERDRRPYVYIPVNISQFKKVANYYYQMRETDPLNAFNARVWPADNLELRFPPPRYDAFALIGVGPTENTWGVVPMGPAEGEPPNTDPASYHIRALRAFYLATRDANDNMSRDFDFRSRTGGDTADADPESYVAKGLPGALCLLPAQSAGQGPAAGPVIYVYGYGQ